MDGVALMKRTDTKFVIHRTKLNQILKDLENDYLILEIDGKRLMTYSSEYFDTENYKFYYDHHHGRKVRAKVRVREYVDSNISFIEVKQKTNKGQTIKTRIKVEGQSNLHNTNTFANEILQQKELLKASIINDFKRITLVSNIAKERVTFDTDINFNNTSWNDNLVIIELKQERLKRSSPLFQTLKKLQIHPARISKYCLGMSAEYPQLKVNNFKPIFRNIHKQLTWTSF